MFWAELQYAVRTVSFPGNLEAQLQQNWIFFLTLIFWERIISRPADCKTLQNIHVDYHYVITIQCVLGFFYIHIYTHIYYFSIIYPLGSQCKSHAQCIVCLLPVPMSKRQTSTTSALRLQSGCGPAEGMHYRQRGQNLGQSSSHVPTNAQYMLAQAGRDFVPLYNWFEGCSEAVCCLWVLLSHTSMHVTSEDSGFVWCGGSWFGGW